MKLANPMKITLAAAIASVAALTLAAAPATASATAAGPGARPATAAVDVEGNVSASKGTTPFDVCGFYENNIRAYYNHCGTTHVVIKIDGRPSYLWCIGPGHWDIGSAASVDNAYYIGRTC
jgi:hypothetical protein